MAHKKKMNAAAIAAYKTENENFLANLRGRAGIQELRCGVLYKVVQTAPAPPADADERGAGVAVWRRSVRSSASAGGAGAVCTTL